MTTLPTCPKCHLHMYYDFSHEVWVHHETSAVECEAK